jgi:hypothetical protein
MASRGFRQGRRGWPGLLLVRAGNAKDFGQAHADGVAEQAQVIGPGAVRDGGQALFAGGVRGMDEAAERICGLSGPDRVEV